MIRDSEGTDLFIFWDARLSAPQIIQIVTAFVAATLIIWLFRSTAAGRIVRAVSSNEDLAAIQGLSVRMVRLSLSAIAGLVAGIGGVLTGLDVDLTPSMGLAPLFYAIAASVIGGAGSVRGAVLGCLAVGVMRNLAVVFAPAHWNDVFVFLMLLAVLLFRPQGFLRRPVGENGV